MKDSLVAFKEQMRREHEERKAAFRREAEERISDMIASRRSQAEKDITRWRQDRREVHERQEQILRQRALGRYRHLRMEVVRELVARVMAQVEFRFQNADAEERRRWLVLLAKEALGCMRGKAVLMVRPGDEDAVRELPGVEQVEGIVKDSWGGCVSRDAADGRHMVDNTFRTRWSRSEAFFAAQLGMALGGQEDDVERFARELRLY